MSDRLAELQAIANTGKTPSYRHSIANRDLAALLAIVRAADAMRDECDIVEVWARAAAVNTMNFYEVARRALDD